MGNKKKQWADNSGLIKVRFSIGAKLITIITIILFLSLGTITALTSWIAYKDLKKSVELEILDVNSRSAQGAESTIANFRSNSRILIQTIDAAGSRSALSRTALESFFEENRQAAAIYFTVLTREGDNFKNDSFLESNGIDAAAVDAFWQLSRSVINRTAAGETIIINAAPHFKTPMLALFFPWKNGSAGILFSPASLNAIYLSDIYQSYLLNDSNDVLVYPNSELVLSGANFAGQEFIQEIRRRPERNYLKPIEVDPEFVGDDVYTSYWKFLRLKWKNLRRNVQILLSEGVSADFSFKTQNENEKVYIYMANTKLNIASAVVITSVEYDRVFENIAVTMRRNLYLTGAVLSISIILIWFFSKSISIPLKTLAGAAHKIESGTFDFDIQRHNARDEIGVLNASFQRMCKALNIFGRFTNREIAVRAMSGEIKPGGLSKNATIFFSDIRDFTVKTENITKILGNEASNRIVYWLNNYFTQMIDCVEKTGGIVDKFIGDAVMAHWGTVYTSGSPKSDAYNCVAAALMMRKALYFMNKNRRANDPGDPPIRIGCGINTGIVTAGQLGSERRMEYTVIGDPVNLASRIESLTKPLGVDILISEDTWNFVKDDFITEEMPSVTVKGKLKPVRLFAVINSVGGDPRPGSLYEVRKLLGIMPPDLSAVDINAEEKKYKIGE